MSQPIVPGMLVLPDLCTGCRICARDCPVDVITMEPTAPGSQFKEIAVIHDDCVRCDVCMKVCPFDAIERPQERRPHTSICDACPVLCEIPEGAIGACKRYTNQAGAVVRVQPLVVPPAGSEADPTAVPVVTGIGAGTTYPCFKPAPFIIRDHRAGVDVVSVVTEVPLSYCNLEVQIESATPIGEVGEEVKCKNRSAGLVAAHRFGKTVLDLGGINHIESTHSAVITQMMIDLCNGQPVRLRIGGRIHLDLQLGQTPLVQDTPVVAADGQPGKLSLFFVGGVGGSARAGVTRYPIRLTDSVHEGKVRVTAGGAPVFVFPGTNIIIGFDVQRVMAPDGFSRLPIPAVVIPLEYTMPVSLYEEIGGHIHAVRDRAVLEQANAKGSAAG